MQRPCEELSVSRYFRMRSLEGFEDFDLKKNRLKMVGYICVPYFPLLGRVLPTGSMSLSTRHNESAIRAGAGLGVSLYCSAWRVRNFPRTTAR